VLLAVGELAARVLVSRAMDPEELRIRTHDTDVKGRYRSHPRLPYVPLPGYPSHDSHGFRNPELAPVKSPDVVRIACLGGSTTYGHQLEASQAWPARLAQLLVDEGKRVEVINAGVPGWVSHETLISFEERVLPLEPDIVVVYQGRNELFPQAFNGYRPDYLHFRDPAWDFAHTNSAHKAVFRRSYLAMLVCTHDGQRFFWESRLENPIYGCNLKANVPTPDEVVRNLADPARTEAYRDNVTRLVESARDAGAEVVLCTMAFRAERFASGMLPEDPSTHDALAAQVEENNAVVREVATRLEVSIAETGAMAEQPDWFRDDCHMTPAGHTRRAEIVRSALRAEGLVP
jgi:lysophospholipase L1-like esterase